MKKLSFGIMTLLVAWTFQACNNMRQDPIGSANESNELKQETADSSFGLSATVSEEDSRFSVSAIGSGLMEISAAEVAQQRAQSERVKEFAKELFSDHTKANETLKTLAASKNITIPIGLGEDHQKDIDKLSEKSGKEFDKEYIEEMISDHKDNIDAFEKASKNAADADIKAFAEQTLPVLRTHLQMAESIYKDMK